ncbi:MAG TPA: hypothetical protein DCE18_11135 [Syntrophobacteraceae bacterium]|nr:hypothetical protein [Syntrophobacteraceae bacterium]
MTGEGGFEKLVAIKRILPHLSDDPEFVDMFMREARLAALLSHPNIVQIYDFGREQATYYIAMEYLWGNDLRAVLQRTKDQHPLPIECALYIASRICAGLEYSHNLRDLSGKPLNIIHRDVNPQNVILTHQGEVKILDFGIAKIAEMDSTTKVGTLKGKVPYMSPEQAAGQIVDKRSDIFSTGVILYEMLTGAKAFQGAAMEVLERVRKAEFTPPELVVPDLPPEVCEILHRSLAKNPEQRFQTCAEMFRRLDDCLTLFSERQNAENLARQIRHLFVDELFEAKSHEGGGVCAHRPVMAGSPGSEITRTLMLEAEEPSMNDADPSDQDSVSSGPRLWLSVLLAITVILAAVFYRYGPVKGLVDKATLSETADNKSQVQSIAASPTGMTTGTTEHAGQVAGANATVLFQHGLELLGTDPNGARDLIEKSVQADPSNVDGHFELGKLHGKLGNQDEAMKSYRNVVQLDPNHSRALFNLGLLYAERGEFAHGEQVFARVVALAPTFLDQAYFNLAMMQRRQGKTEDSIQSMARAVAANPINSKALAYLRLWKEER